MKVAIAFSTKDRVELSRQSIKPVIDNRFDIFWVDGSTEPEALAYFNRENVVTGFYPNVRGGADIAIAHNLTMLLKHPDNYDYIGLVENDVLLDADWFEHTMRLFAKGEEDGLMVGAVSARAYEDRILIQRDGYAVMHNIGAGQIILTRKAAQLVLKHFRVGWAPDNRTIFNTLSGIDIGAYWAFRGNAQWVTTDWYWDALLASHGLCSLALTPCKAQMIGQVPPLAEQGLTLAEKAVEERRNDEAFELFKARTRRIRAKTYKIAPESPIHVDNQGVSTIFPHQIGVIGGEYSDGWRTIWSQGFGPFAYRAAEATARIVVPVSGPCVVFVSGGEAGGRVNITDTESGFSCNPDLPPEGEQTQVLQVQVPAAVSYRDIHIEALTPGVVFYGLQTRERQPYFPDFSFDYSVLPPA